MLAYKQRTILGILALLTVVFAALAWNHPGIPLPQQAPTSTISADIQEPALHPSLADLATGATPQVVRTAWTFQVEEATSVPPVVAENLIYIVAGKTLASSHLLALDARTGQPSWQRSLDGIADHQPVIAGEFLYMDSIVGGEVGEMMKMQSDIDEQLEKAAKLWEQGGLTEDDLEDEINGQVVDYLVGDD